MIHTSKSSQTDIANKFGLYNVGANYFKDRQEQVYECSFCQDREIVQSGIDQFGSPLFVECTCKAKKNAARKLKSSGLKEQQLKYKLGDYKVNAGNREMFEGVKLYLKAWPGLINSSAAAKGFFMCGNAGIGKTMLSCIIAKDMLNKGIAVVFVSSADIMAELRQAQFSKDEEGIEAKINILASAQALIIDDVGKEKSTEWVQSMYYRLIDLRYRNNLLTGFNANYSPGELEERFGEFGGPTVSRILGMTRDYILHAEDEDHRIEG